MYDKSSRTVCCVNCGTSAAEDQTPVVSGLAGASAARQNQRLHDAREKRVRERHPKIGGFLLAVTEDPQSTRAWATGAAGEQKLGAWLDGVANEHVTPLHDRGIRGTKANIDHLVVGPQGVFVIDAKKYTGQVTHHVDGGFFTPRVDKLIVGRRDCTKLAAGVEKQVGHVRAALDAAGLTEVPAYGFLAFVDATWGLFSRPFTIGTVTVLWPRRMAELAGRPGDLDTTTVRRALTVIAAAFPAYT
ncbi:nuclease-related domain-containing protein [Leifsonia sp. NPDC058248]|uniref:nuclease-related domain-containing protein n=1 Tax=Leifsonia sp. NPDC058248 TaxID=3346402 RepID=UPI0036DE014C